MKKALLLPLASAVLGLSACAESPETAFTKAQAEFASHDYAAARIHLANALAGKPGDRQMLLLQVKTLIALGDGDGAGTAIEQLAGKSPPPGELSELAAEAALLRKNPDAVDAFLAKTATPEASRLRALAEIQRGNIAQAASLFEKGVAAGGNARLFADYARLRLMGGDLAGASDLIARAARLSPDGIDTLLVSGEIAVRHGDLQAALGFYDKAERLYPVSVAALVGKMAVLGDLGRIDEMKPLLAKAQAFAPKDPGVQFIAIRLAALEKDWGKVRDLVQPIEANLPELDPIRLLYGEALLRLNLTEQALAQLQPLARAQPGNRDVALLVAEAQFAQGNAKAAMATLKPFADSPAARHEELVLMAKIAKAAGSPAAAGYEARSRQPQPQSLVRDIADADAAMRAGNWAGAVASYDRILSATDGRNVIVLNNLAYAQLMLGNTAKAVDFSKRALALAPDNPSVMDTAGWALFKSGREPAKARSLLRRAAQLAPGNMTIKGHLAEAERGSR